MTSKMNNNKASAQQRSARKATTNRTVFKQAILPLAITALSGSGALHAQEQKATNERFIEEVIVTTERRTQSLQDVAGTVQAFSTEDLTALGVGSDFKNLQNIVTGLHIANQEGKLEVFLRGIGSSDSDFASDPSVATHYNGVYLPRPRSIGPMFFDVERVEVNKGPQGTLRGRNATGGTINIISKRPDYDGISGDITAGVGSYKQRHLEGAINLPVNDTLAFRVAGYSETRDSYMDNAFSKLDVDLDGLAGQGSRLADAFGGDIETPGSMDDQALRVSALYEPNDVFSMFILADKVWQNGSSVPGSFAGRSLSAGYDIDDLSDPYSQYFVNEGGMDNDIQGVAGTFSLNLSDAFNIELNSSYREYDFKHRNAAREWQIGFDYPDTYDADGNVIGGAADVAEAVILGNEQTAYGNFTQTEKSESIINELRLHGETDKFVYSAGVFSFSETFSGSSQDFNHGWWGDCGGREGAVCGWLNGLSSENRNDKSTVDSFAVFADGSYSVNDRFRVKAGLRFTEDEKVAKESNAQYQLILDEQALLDYGLDGPQDIVMGTNGLQLTGANDRPNKVVPLGESSETKQYFLDGIANWGSNDNLDDIIAQSPNAFNVKITSDFEGINGQGNIISKNKESYSDWRLGAEYDISDSTMTYLTLSTGTRAGGINRPIPDVDTAGNPTATVVSWEPEELMVYEIGAKTEFSIADLPVRLNSAAFYYDYKNKVVQGLIAVCPPTDRPADGGPCSNNQVINQNAANVSLLGFELDGDILLPADFRLRANFAYLDSQFDDAEILDTRQDTSNEAMVNLDGNMLPNTSKFNLNLALSQNFDFNRSFINSVDWTLSGNYRSKYYLSPYNSRGFDADGNNIPLEDMTVSNHWLITGAGFPEANGNFLKDGVPSTFIMNLNAGITMGDNGQYRVEAWVSNLTDKTYATKAFVNNSVNIRFLNTPRMAGLRLKARF